MIKDFEITDGILRVNSSVTYIRSQQFAQRGDFRKVILPAGVGFMEEEAFAECGELEEAELPEGLVNIGVAAFASCEKLRKINVPSTVKQIEQGAFLFCGELSRIELPQGLEVIGELAFQESGLERVSIPPSVTLIGEEAFFGCPALTHIDVLGERTEICQNAFGSDYALLDGYIAPGYPAEDSRSALLLYSLLWCTCPERHTIATCTKAERFIRENEALIMEKVLKLNNIPAMTGLASRKLIKRENIDSYMRLALENGQTEITALLLQAGGGEITDGDFDL